MTSYTMGNYTYSPFSIGFENLFDRLENLATHTKGSSYPPYNIVKEDEDTYHIEMALAGLKEDDIDITLKDNVLSVVYDKTNEDARDYTYRGISARKFFKEFTLSEFVKVVGASMEDGILTIVLQREIPEERKPRKISITGKKELLLED